MQVPKKGSNAKNNSKKVQLVSKKNEDETSDDSSDTPKKSVNKKTLVNENPIVKRGRPKKIK